MKPTTENYVKRLKKMLERADKDNIEAMCPGAAHFHASKDPNCGLRWDDLSLPWCPTCQEFMGMPVGSGLCLQCPCNYYGKVEAIRIALERIRRWENERA